MGKEFALIYICQTASTVCVTVYTVQRWWTLKSITFAHWYSLTLCYKVAVEQIEQSHEERVEEQEAGGKGEEGETEGEVPLLSSFTSSSPPAIARSAVTQRCTAESLLHRISDAKHNSIWERERQTKGQEEQCRGDKQRCLDTPLNKDKIKAGSFKGIVHPKYENSVIIY